ncbi:MAG: 2-dehydro-3-deoxygalactonokinase [Gammaproteobacteria bacterium]|nr:2-dehydro-3-deoxygalactonokinase [Gammaproteobacteria bacterium]
MLHRRNRNNSANFIAVDWGSSNFRAYVVDELGRVGQRTKAHQGIARVKDESFPKTTRRLLGKWFNKYPETPVIMSGMIGSRQGWQEVAYVSCPATIGSIAAGTEKIVNHTFERDIYIVPGLKLARGNDDFDIMRGEEIQAFGALQELPPADRHLICLPGTHTKWVEIRNGEIVNFKTFVTGEIFSLLARYSVLSSNMDGVTYYPEVFAKGLKMAMQSDDLLGDIFKVRIQALLGKLRPPEVSSYLSALLIGAEIKSAQKMFGDIKNIAVVAAPWLIEMYEQCLAPLNITVTGIKTDQASVNGLLQIFKLLPDNLDEDIEIGNKADGVKSATPAQRFAWN